MSNKTRTLSLFSCCITALIFLAPLFENGYSQTRFVPFVEDVPSNLSYPPSDIAWTGTQFIITTIEDGTLNTVSTRVLSPFATECFKIEGEESHIAIAKPENYRFCVGNIYVSNGPVIWQIDPTGSKCMVFANLTGSLVPIPFIHPSNLTHTQITFDGHGTFGNNMLATTYEGSVWIIDHNGIFDRLASNVGTAFGRTISECLDVAPADFGPHSGKLIVGSQSSTEIYAIGNDGNISTLKFQTDIGELSETYIPIEMCHFMPHNINTTNPTSGMYITSSSLENRMPSPTGNKSSILKAPADAFIPYAGNLILTGEVLTIDPLVHSIAYNASSGTYFIEGVLEGPFEPPGMFNKYEGFVYVNNANQISN